MGGMGFLAGFVSKMKPLIAGLPCLLVLQKAPVKLKDFFPTKVGETNIGQR